MIYTPGDKTKDIILEIKTLIIDEGRDIEEDLGRLLDRISQGEKLSDQEMARILAIDEANEIELCTEAAFSTSEQGSIEITYRENEDDPTTATLSKIIFRPESPNMVAMMKKGAINTVLSFEEGKTHICTYDTLYMPFRIYVFANKVDNKLLSDGTLQLDYILNINDSSPQHFIITVTVKEAPEDVLKELFR